MTRKAISTCRRKWVGRKAILSISEAELEMATQFYWPPKVSSCWILDKVVRLGARRRWSGHPCPGGLFPTSTDDSMQTQSVYKHMISYVRIINNGLYVTEGRLGIRLKFLSQALAVRK